MIDFDPKKAIRTLAYWLDRTEIDKFQSIVKKTAEGNGNYLSRKEEHELLIMAMKPSEQLELTEGNAKRALLQICDNNGIALESEVSAKIRGLLTERLHEHGYLDESFRRSVVADIAYKNRISESIVESICEIVISHHGFRITSTPNASEAGETKLIESSASVSILETHDVPSTPASTTPMPMSSNVTESVGDDADAAETIEDDEDEEIPPVNLARLEEFLAVYDKAGLAGLCGELGLSKTGTKEVLTKRILALAEEATAAANEEARSLLFSGLVADLDNSYKSWLKETCESLGVDSRGAVDKLKTRILEFLFDDAADDDEEIPSVNVARLAELLAYYEKDGLAELCRVLQLNVTGSTDALAERILEFAADTVATDGETKVLLAGGIAVDIGNSSKEWLKATCEGLGLDARGAAEALRERICIFLFSDEED